MHLVLPFAAPLADPGRAALAGLAWPVLSRQLAGLDTPQRDDAGDEWSLSPPHERAVAAAIGWPIGDGLLPLAAVWAAADGIERGAAALGLLTPAHWHLGTEQISMGNPEALLLDSNESRETLGAVAPLFTSEGFALHWGAPLRWYLEHPSLAALPTASLDRVIGRNVDAWLGAEPALRLVRRLQNEVQMLLYEHPINLRRSERGQLPINSFWLSGTGRSQPPQAALPRVDERLKRSALAEDWAGWAKAWALVDADLAATPWQALTLCGERSSLTWRRGAALPWWKGAAARWRSVDVAALLEGL